MKVTTIMNNVVITPPRVANLSLLLNLSVLPLENKSIEYKKFTIHLFILYSYILKYDNGQVERKKFYIIYLNSIHIFYRIFIKN